MHAFLLGVKCRWVHSTHLILTVKSAWPLQKRYRIRIYQGFKPNLH